MAIEYSLEERANLDLLRATLKGLDVEITAAKWGSQEPVKYSGRVTNVNDCWYIEYVSEQGLPGYVHFCGLNEGIAMITTRDGELLFVNKNVPQAYARNRRDESLMDDEKRWRLFKGSILALYAPRLPKEIQF